MGMRSLSARSRSRVTLRSPTSPREPPQLRREQAQLLEGAGVEQQREALARGELALLVLALDSLRPPHGLLLGPQPGERLHVLFHAHDALAPSRPPGAFVLKGGEPM